MRLPYDTVSYNAMNGYYNDSYTEDMMRIPGDKVHIIVIVYYLRVDVGKDRLRVGTLVALREDVPRDVTLRVRECEWDQSVSVEGWQLPFTAFLETQIFFVAFLGLTLAAMDKARSCVDCRRHPRPTRRTSAY
jgi:hypothetical protein